jgi:two-component system NtrC family sensor kinase
MRLAAKLILLFLLGVLGIVALFSWQTIQRHHVLERERREIHASNLVAAMTPSLEQAHRKGGVVTIREVVEHSTTMISDARLRWVDGKDIPVVVQRTRKVTTVSIADLDGFARTYVPLTLNGESVGAIEVAQPVDRHNDTIRYSMTESILLLLGVTALSGLTICLGGVFWVGRPLRKLVNQVTSIGEGQLNQPVALESKDELGDLAQAISAMSHRLSQQRETIRHTDRLGTIGTLAAGVAHELGTPLNVVAGRAGLIVGGKLTPEEVQTSAQTIHSETDRMTGIVRQLLEFARQSPSSHGSIDLTDVVSRTCDLMQSLASKSSVKIESVLPRRAIVVEGDAAQLQQVLTNLISNAIAAMSDGGIATVSLSDRSEINQICLQVTDCGQGIKQEDVSRIFEPFFTTKDVGKGTGLGLSIAYGIVREHGGDIRVTSEPGSFTTFSVYLPTPTT